MSFKKIRLTPMMIADLYATSLVIGPEKIASATAKLTQSENKPVKYLGNHAKKVMIAVNYEDISYLPDEDLGFLTNILSACKLSLDDVAVVNITVVDGNALQKELLSKVVLLFGISPVDFGLPVNFPEFQIQQLNGVTYLYCPMLKPISEDKLLGSKLWVTLKKIFNI